MSFINLDSIRKRVADLADSAAEIASQTGQLASDAAQKAGTLAADVKKAIDENETIQSARRTVVDTAESVGGSIAAGADAAKSKVSEWGADVGELFVDKIKRLCATIDYDKTIADVQRVGAEKNIKVDALVDFLTKLKNFSSDGD